MRTGRVAAFPTTGAPLRDRPTAAFSPNPWKVSALVRVDELDAVSPPVATPPGAGARRASAVLVRLAVFAGMRLWVDLNSLPENIGLPDALVGPDDPPELL